MKPIKKWSRFVEWAMSDIRRDINTKIYAFHNDPQRKVYVGIGTRHTALFIMAFTEVISKKKGDCRVIIGTKHSPQPNKYRVFACRALDSTVLRQTRRQTIMLHIASCIEQSQPVVEFEDGSRMEATKRFDYDKSRAKIAEILTDYLK